MAVVGRVLLMPRGSFVMTDVYNRLDWVRDGGAAWVCKQDNVTGIRPSLSTPEWQVLAQDGTVGGWSSIASKPFETIGNGLAVNSSNELTLAKSATTDKVTVQALNELLTGTGTAGYDAGSGASPRYFPAKYIYNTALTSVADGDMITVKMPVAGSEYGTYLSIDGGSNYYPIALYDDIKFATEYGVGDYVTLIFVNNGAVDDIYPVTGGNTPGTVTGGAFRVVNYHEQTVDQTYDGTSANAQSGTAVAEAVDEYTAYATRTNGKVTFDNLNPDYGYDLEWETVDANGVDAVDAAGTDHIDVPKWSQVSKTAGTNPGTDKLIYTVDGVDGETRFCLRIKK